MPNRNQESKTVWEKRDLKSRGEGKGGRGKEKKVVKSSQKWELQVQLVLQHSAKKGGGNEKSGRMTSHRNEGISEGFHGNPLEGGGGGVKKKDKKTEGGIVRKLVWELRSLPVPIVLEPGAKMGGVNRMEF